MFSADESPSSILPTLSESTHLRQIPLRGSLSRTTLLLLAEHLDGSAHSLWGFLWRSR